MQQEQQAFAQAEALFNQGQVEAASALCSQLLQINPRNAEALALSGIIALHQGDAKTAEKQLNKAAKQHPNHAPFQLFLGKALLFNNQSAKAGQSFQKAIKLSQKNPAVLAQIGDAYAQAARYPEAERYYQQSITILPRANHINNLGAAQLRQGKRQEALESFAKAKTLDPDLLDAVLNHAGLLFETGNAAQAIAEYETCTNQHPDSTNAHAGLARIHLLQERYNAVLQHADAALRIDPNHAQSLLCKGMALSQMLATDEALSLFEQVHAATTPEQPEHIEAMVRQAILLERLNRVEEARHLLDVLTSAQCAHPLFPILQAKLARRDNKLDDAAQFTRTALQRLRAPEFSLITDMHYLLGTIEEKRGNYAEALASIEQAKMVERDHIGLPALEAENYTKAIDGYRQWLQKPETRSLASQWQSPDDGLPEPVFLFGFPRSGTTLLEQALYTSDRVQVGNEGGFIANLIQRFQQERPGGMGLPDALEHLDDTTSTRFRTQYWEDVGKEMPLKPDTIFIDKHPLQFVHLALLQRIFPKCKLLFMLRDPRDVCTSCFIRGFTTPLLRYHFNTLENTAKLYADTMDLFAIQQAVLPTAIHRLRYEDMVNDFEAELKAVCEFIGLEWSENMLHYYDTRYRRSQVTPSYDAISKPVYASAMGRWQHYSAAFAEVEPILASYIEKHGYALGEAA